MIKRSCLCGAVSIESHGPLHGARYCHCKNCRKFSGTSYAAWGLAETNRLIVTPSEPNVTKYNSGGGLRVFCSECGSPPDTILSTAAGRQPVN